jgi:hypothetical protein
MNDINDTGQNRKIRSIPVPEFLAKTDAETARNFFDGLQLRNGVYKATRRNRLDDGFPLLIDAARSLGKHIHILDLGCSSGISTIEMHRALKKAGFDCTTTGSDILMKATYVRHKNGDAILFDDAAMPIQVETRGWATTWSIRRRDLFFHPFKFAGTRFLLNLRINTFRAALTSPVKNYHIQSISLLTNEAQATPETSFFQEDAMSPTLSQTFEIVRAANFLNVGYFNETQIKTILDGIRKRLINGGFLFVLRTHEETGINHGTLFKFEAGIFKQHRVLHEGSEITPYMQNFSQQ